MRRGTRGGQRGIALLALLAVLVIGGTWYLVSRLQQLSANRTAVERARNAEVLNRAKQALIGYVIAQANHANENNPGALPCPEAPASFNDLTGTDGKTNSGGCAGPAVGRYPWRTIGTDKLVDAAGEPLWYVVSPGWAVTCSTCTTTINSNSTGQLTVDGVAPAALPAADTVIALLIAPGLPFSVPAAAGCVAWSQSRPATPDVPPDVRNYLECDNSNGDSSFVTTGPSGSFNDQVLKVTVGDLMPGLEAAVADRVMRTGEFFDTLKTVYASGTWGLGNVMYPFAATFVTNAVTGAVSDPSASTLQGASTTCSSGVCAGLLPVTISETSPGSGAACAGTEVLPCAASFVAWSGTPTMSGASVYSTDCSTSTATTINCSFYYRCLLLSCISTTTVPFSVTATASNVGNALRTINVNATMTNVDTTAGSRTYSAVMATDGSASITLNGNANVTGAGGFLGDILCGLVFPLNLILGCKQSTISVPIRLVADHPILDTSTAASYGWFLRNKWHQVTYYAVAANQAPGGAPNPSCNNSTTCLTVANPPATGGAAGTQRAIAIMMGRSINGRARPGALLGDYLEFGNVGAAYENQGVRDSVRNVLTDAGAANAYSVSVSSVSVGQPIYFRASSANTGASTLTTTATGSKSLVNSDGTALSASQIRANNALLVTWDGTKFVLAAKRPFNDRVLVIDHN